MPTPSTVVTLVPAIHVLAQCLARTSENYQHLLKQPESYTLCTEAGHSLRYLSKRYAQVLMAALAYPPDADATENWDNEDESLSEEMDFE